MPDIAITPDDRVRRAEERGERIRRDDLRHSVRRRWHRDATALAVVALLLRLPMLLAGRALVFDDGVFGASAIAMRGIGIDGTGGGVPFRDVFSSQGPLFLPLVFVADLVGLRTTDAPRLLAVASGVVLTVAVYACGRRLTSRGGALLAAGLVTTSGSVLWVTGPINADGPALALSVVAVACALRYRDEPSVGEAALVGLAAGAALSIKFLAVPAVLVAGLVVLVTHRRVRDAVVTGATAIGVYVVAALPWGIERVWEQSYAYHADARRQGSVGDALVKILRTLWERDLAVVVALVLAAVVAVLVGAAAARRTPLETAHRLGPEAIGGAAWAVLVVAVLLYEPALWRAHVAHLVIPLALLAALRPPPWRVLLVAAVVVVPVSIATRGDLWWPGGYDRHEAALIHYLQTSHPDAEFISDDPGLVWRAGRHVPDWFVDPSFQRVDNGDITAESLAQAWDLRVCGYIVTSPDRYGRLTGLRDALEQYWNQRPRSTSSPVPDHWWTVKHFGPNITVYVPTWKSMRHCGQPPG